MPSLDFALRDLKLVIDRGKDPLSTLHVLQRATSISEESMRCHPIARSLTGELVTSGGRLVESDARALAGRLGLTV